MKKSFFLKKKESVSSHLLEVGLEVALRVDHTHANLTAQDVIHNETR